MTQTAANSAPATGGSRGILQQITANWPPLVYALAGLGCVGIWLIGTAVQVQTSEAWIMQVPLDHFPTLGVFGQIWDFFHGNLPSDMVVPFTFGWGTQIALVLGSLGIELPKKPAWRWYLAVGGTILLIAVNSAGDFNYSEHYGAWGQMGFTVVIFFMTFVVGLIAIMCFVHAASKMKA